MTEKKRRRHTREGRVPKVGNGLAKAGEEVVDAGSYGSDRANWLAALGS